MVAPSGARRPFLPFGNEFGSRRTLSTTREVNRYAFGHHADLFERLDRFGYPFAQNLFLKRRVV